MEAQQNVFIADFIESKDATLAVVEAIDYCKKIKAKKLIFPKGKYDFFTTYAYQEYGYIHSNGSFNDNYATVRHILFNLSDMNDFEVDGGGSEFIFHDYLCPFWINNCTNIILNNFSIDFVRTFHSEGEVVAFDEKSKNVDVSLTASYPYKIIDDKLTFWDETYTIKYPWWIVVTFDPTKKEPAYNDGGFYLSPDVFAKETKPGVVRFYYEGQAPKVGNRFIFNACHRAVCAIAINESCNTKVYDVDIYHCGGMGVIAQNSKDISIDKLRITPAPNSGRMLSITADATHFANCSGIISLTNSLIENQQDDAFHAFGIYAGVKEILSSNELIVSYAWGVEGIFENNELEFLNPQTYITYSEGIKVKEKVRLNYSHSKITVEGDLPSNVQIGDLVARISEFPEILIRNCTIRSSRGRGILPGSRGKVIIENNYFHNQESAIIFNGQCYVQSAIRNLTLRGNTFDNCCFGSPTEATIMTNTDIKPEYRGNNFYHHNILIENNTFRTFNSRILEVYCIDGLTFRNNITEISTDYEPTDDNKELFKVVHCSNIIIE